MPEPKTKSKVSLQDALKKTKKQPTNIGKSVFEVTDTTIDAEVKDWSKTHQELKSLDTQKKKLEKAIIDKVMPTFTNQVKFGKQTCLLNNAIRISVKNAFTGMEEPPPEFADHFIEKRTIKLKDEVANDDVCMTKLIELLGENFTEYFETKSKFIPEDLKTYFELKPEIQAQVGLYKPSFKLAGE